MREILLLDFISHSYNCLYSTQYYSSNTVLIARSVPYLYYILYHSLFVVLL